MATILNKGGPIQFGGLMLVKGRNPLSEEELEELKRGCQQNPGWGHAAEGYFKSGRLSLGEPPPPPAPPSPAELAAAKAKSEAEAKAAQDEVLAKIPMLDAPALDALFQAQKAPGPVMDAVVARLKELAKPKQAEAPAPAPAPKA